MSISCSSTSRSFINGSPNTSSSSSSSSLEYLAYSGLKFPVVKDWGFRFVDKFHQNSRIIILLLLFSPKQIVLLLYSLVKHNCHRQQEASSCSEFHVQNHNKNKEIRAHTTCVTWDQMATGKWASPLQRHCNDVLVHEGPGPHIHVWVSPKTQVYSPS